MKPSMSSAKDPPTNAITTLASTSVNRTRVEAMSIALRRRKPRPSPLSSNTTFSARRAASSAPVVPYRASGTLTASAVAAVPSLSIARRSERLTGSRTEGGTTPAR
jgi:hypothetical protein